MSVLPRHTKVVVTGNNRTKSVLVGLHGVVKNAVGLGGWHWLVLTNGMEVKLQRNALCVIEPPTGNEFYGDMQCNSSDLASHDTQSPKPELSRNRQHRVFNSKSLSTSCDSHTKKVDLTKLGSTALWRYWHHFNLDASPNPSREHLVDAVQKHFMSQVIASFAHAAKRLKTSVKVA